MPASVPVVNEATIARFYQDGFDVVPSPLSDSSLEELRVRHDEIAPQWAATDWPDHVHKLASQFALMGECAFALAERPDLLATARTILRTDEVFVGACAAGDTVTAESIDGRPVTSLQWHSAPGRGGQYGEKWDQVALRFPMDVHDPSNGGLHLLPGSQDLPKKRTEDEIRATVLRSDDGFEWNNLVFGTHPDQVVLYPKPGEMIVWTPNIWHCTGANPDHIRRRSIMMTYFPAGGRFRDPETLRTVLGEDVIASWTPARRRLWGVG